MPYLCHLEKDVHPEGGGARDGLGCRRPGGHHQPHACTGDPQGSGLHGLSRRGRLDDSGTERDRHGPRCCLQRRDQPHEPMYASLLLLTWGAFLKDVSLAGFLLSVAASTFLVVTAHVEERENMVRFGEAYSAFPSG